MDKPMDAYEIGERTALLIAKETARLPRDLAEFENRLELVERAMHWALQD